MGLIQWCFYYFFFLSERKLSLVILRVKKNHYPFSYLTSHQNEGVIYLECIGVFVIIHYFNPESIKYNISVMNT